MADHRSAWTWAAARARGTSHGKTATPCQDHFRALAVHDRFVAIVSDGAGSAAEGGAGSTLAVRCLTSLASTWLDEGHGGLPDNDLVAMWIEAARTRIREAAEPRALTSRDFACTLVGCIAVPEDTLLMLIGDGAVAVRIDGAWSAPGWPEHGEYASTTFFLTDEPAARLRLVRLGGPTEAIALMSDGLERLALDFAGNRAHAPFFEAIVRPVEASAVIGRDAQLSAALGRYLDSDTINARTDDDKTLVLAVRR